MDGSLPFVSPAPQLPTPASDPRGEFDRAVRPLLPKLRASALRLAGTPADAEDLLQESLLRAFRFWPSYRKGTNVAAWLRRILKNTFINIYRKRRREYAVLGELRAQELAEDVHARSLTPADEALSDDVEAALGALPPEFRAVLWEVAVNERTYGEAAASLGCPVGTVMSRLHRARRALVPDLRGYAAPQAREASA